MGHEFNERSWDQVLRDLQAEGLLDAEGRVTEKGHGLGEREQRELARTQPCPTKKSPRKAG